MENILFPLIMFGVVYAASWVVVLYHASRKEWVGMIFGMLFNMFYGFGFSLAIHSLIRFLLDNN